MHNMPGSKLSGEFKATLVAVRKRFCCARHPKIGGEIFSGFCFDQSVGIVGDILKNKRIEDEWRKDIKELYVTTTELRRLILVLESPHKDEFDENKKSLGPAQRGTATGIIHNLESIIRPVCDGFLERELILVNAIQFQCSQGLKLRGKGCEFNRGIKDFVFEKLLDCKSFVDDFMDRLRNVYRCDCGDIVVNVVGINSLTSCRVGRLIQKVTGKCSCGLGHPSAWSRSKQSAQQLASERSKRGFCYATSKTKQR